MLPYCPYCGHDLKAEMLLGSVNPAKLYERETDSANDVLELTQSCATCRVNFKSLITVLVERRLPDKNE